MLRTSKRAADRLAWARRALRDAPAQGDVVVLTGHPEAAAAVVRAVGRSTFGWQRVTLSRWAALLAEPLLLERRLTVASSLSLEAVWARVVFDLQQRGQLGRFAPVEQAPGLGRALHRTVSELRLAGAGVDALGAQSELQAAWAAWHELVNELRLVDSAEVYRLATERLKHDPSALRTALLVAVDVPLLHLREVEFARHVVAAAKDVSVVLPARDEQSLAAWRAVLGDRAQGPTAPDELPVEGEGALAQLQRRLFASPGTGGDAPTAPTTEVELLSAPGEARECVELARRVLEHAARGVPFERMAVLLRSPPTYRAPMAEALRRANVPSHFATGTRRPDSAGRAFLALLACANEGLSARRFAEYLSLGQVPKDEQGAPPAPWPSEERYVAPDDEALGLVEDKAPPSTPDDAEDERPDEDVSEQAVVAGGLRAPRRWERLLVDAAVIGGTARWRRRLDGLRESRLREVASPHVSDAQREHLQRELQDLASLSAFALPLLDALAQLPQRGTWREWLEHLASVATRALKRPERVLTTLQELSPLGDVGPVTLAEVRSTLTPRLMELTDRPTGQPSGKVFVAPVDAARGLEFDVVFVPGLAERLFPQKVREDPLLPDAARLALNVPLETNHHRVAAERLALSLAVGAATRAVVLSWPRIEAEHARPRVPSFYVLEVLQAVHGRLPSFEAAQRLAEAAGGARLAWPAPAEPARAIDETEYDLAVLDGVLRGREAREGRAHYLMQLNPTLARALRTRYMRWSQPRWTKGDGLVLNGPLEAQALAKHAPHARAFAPTALEKYAACPYRFILSAVHRLQPTRMPEAIEALGPLERGSLTHEVHYRLLSALRDEGVEVTPETLPALFTRLDEVLERVADTFYDTYAPAIERVWRDGVETARADMREWLRRMADDRAWRPERFEMSFGLPLREQQDPSSQREPVTIDQGLTLRGSIDLVERSTHGSVRATDYKTGKAKAQSGNVVGGGKQLQPALYALVLEKLLPGTTIDSSRLYYCTQVGGFQSVHTPLNQRTRDAVKDVAHALTQAFEKGFFPAAPQKDECAWCDYQPVCGPDEERRVAKKLASAASRQEVELLQRVRALP